MNMNYANGQELHLGDVVKLWANRSGVVVCSMDNSEYSETFSEAEWSYLKNGAMILSDHDGLLYVEDSDGLELISRHPLV